MDMDRSIRIITLKLEAVPVRITGGKDMVLTSDATHVG